MFDKNIKYIMIIIINDIPLKSCYDSMLDVGLVTKVCSPRHPCYATAHQI